MGARARRSSVRSPSRTAKPGHGVQVIVRVRPMLPRELQHDTAVEVPSDKEIVVFKPDAEFASVYNSVLGVHSAQQDLYQLVRGSILSSLDGYNSTVFAYGQTGTGKTHSMMGPPDVSVGGYLAGGSSTAWDKLGIIPRAMADLFTQIQARSSQQGMRIQVAASYLEIYMDRVYDLLQPYKKGMGGRDPADMIQNKALHDVREDKHGNVFVPHALCVRVQDLKGVLALINKGAKHRAVRHTEMNIMSSRSHAILQLVIEQFPQGAQANKGTVLRSKVNFVDLAGNERWNKEVDMGAERVEELKTINGSLSALATVVAALTEKRPHVPYRDSKLTHLLADSLGGNCFTSVIATISPSVSAFDETVSTLKFADRASAIGNNPVVNTSRDLNSVLALKEREIQRLRQLLAEYIEGVKGGAQGGARDTDSAVPAARSTLGTPLPQVNPEQLIHELETTRQALEMERQLRSELEAQLRQSSALDGSQRVNTAPHHQQQHQPQHQQPPHTAASAAAEPPSPARLLPPQIDYLQIQSGAGTPSDCLSPDTHAASTGPTSPNGTWEPFKAVVSRRAELGLGTPTAGTPVQTKRSSGLRQSSPLRYSTAYTHRSSSALGSRSSRNWTPNATQRVGGVVDHQSSMEAAMKSLREQVAQLKQMEQMNKERLAASISAGRAARMAASPLRSRAAPLSPSTGGLLAAYAASTARAGADSFDQLVEAAHHTVQQSRQAVPSVSHPVPSSSTAQSRGWGRSAIQSADTALSAPISLTVPSQSQPLSYPSPQGDTGSQSGWGRSALLGPAMPMSAPSTGGWGRSGIDALTHSTAHTHSHQAPASAQRTGPKLDKGSMIYVLGPSTSSIRAKSLAAATGWG